MAFSTPLKIVYFGVGFTLSCAFTMMALTFVRPLIDSSTPSALRIALMLSPLLVGIPYGRRVARLGQQEQLKLGSALLRALRP